METIFWQSNLALLLCYAVYWAFLRRDTFFRWNRFYLLAAAVFALVFPFLPVPTLFQDAVPEDQVLLFFREGNAVTQTSTQVAVTDSPTLFTWENALLAVYLIGVTFLFIRLIFNLLVIAKLVLKNKLKNTKQGYFIVETDTKTPIFSFLNVLFWNENNNISEEQKAKILAHELVHIRQWHSLDVLFIEIIGIAFWCNPIIWAYKKSLQYLHEYLADAKILQVETSKTEYANLLVSQFLQTNPIPLTNSFFNKSLLKNRITMMYQKKSNQKALAKFALALPILASCFFIAAFSIKNTEVNQPSKAPIRQVSAATNDSSISQHTAYLLYQEGGEGDQTKPNFVGVLGNNISKELYSLTMPSEEEVKFSRAILETLDLPTYVTSARRVYFHSINLKIRKKGNFVELKQYNNVSWKDIEKYREEGDEVIIEFNGTRVKNSQNQWITIDSGLPFTKRLFPSFNFDGC